MQYSLFDKERRCQTRNIFSARRQRERNWKMTLCKTSFSMKKRHCQTRDIFPARQWRQIVSDVVSEIRSEHFQNVYVPTRLGLVFFNAHIFFCNCLPDCSKTLDYFVFGRVHHVFFFVVIRAGVFEIWTEHFQIFFTDPLFYICYNVNYLFFVTQRH